MSEENSCPYLTYKVSMSCQSCTGYSCVAYNRSKKLSEVVQCKDDYWNCQRYLDASGTPVTETIIKVDEIVYATNEGLIVDELSYTTSEEPTIDEPPTPEPTIPAPVVKLFVRNPCGCGEDIRLSNCPYQSTIVPEGRGSCTGIWCYANNKNVRVPKNCWNWQICTVYLMSKYKGVPFP